MTGPSPHVLIWRQPDGLWRWCYTDPGPDGESEVTLLSHRAYDSRDEARSSARAAYPSVDLREPPEQETPARPRRLALRLVVLVVLVVIVIRTLRSRPGSRSTAGPP